MHPMFAAGVQAGREFAANTPAEQLRTLPLSGANPTMGRALWLNALLNRLARDASADTQRLVEAVGHWWIAAARTDRAPGAESAADQICGFASECFALPDGANLDDARATAFARGFLGAIADHLPG